MSSSKLIRSVAVIGAGPAGIACINELAHVSSTGVSTIEQRLKPVNPQFEKIVCFEQNDKIGGVWNFFKTPDPKLPPSLKGNFSSPDEIYEKVQLPKSSILEKTSFKNPYVKISNKFTKDEVRWFRNAAYKDLFTNIPDNFMKFSYQNYKNLSPNRYLKPLISLNDVKSYLDSIISDFKLLDYFRLNSSVELIEKDNINDIWVLTIRHKPRFSKVEQWYKEEFDSVILANGHCNVPFIPKIEGLHEFVSKYPDIVRHSKSFRNANEFKNGSILLCGSGTSSADLTQYLSPIAKNITISQRSETVYDWIKECFDKSPELNFKPRIKKFLPDTKSVQFEDGSIEKFDHIILSTGYHYHFPMLKREDGLIKIYNDNSRSQSPINKIGNLYLYTFSTKDNTFATIGIPTLGLMFHAMEYSAIAIAGVFSGASKLPSKQEQSEWDDKRTKIDKPEVPHRFQGFFTDKLKEQLLTPLFKLGPQGRTDPLTKDGLDPTEVEASNPALVKAFVALKNKKLTPEELLK